jgi:hypothetical protein
MNLACRSHSKSPGRFRSGEAALGSGGLADGKTVTDRPLKPTLSMTSYLLLANIGRRGAGRDSLGSWSSEEVFCPEEVVSGGGSLRGMFRSGSLVEVFSLGGSVFFWCRVFFPGGEREERSSTPHFSFPFLSLPHPSSCVHRKRLSVLPPTRALKTISDV